MGRGLWEADQRPRSIPIEALSASTSPAKRAAAVSVCPTQRIARSSDDVSTVNALALGAASCQVHTHPCDRDLLRSMLVLEHFSKKFKEPFGLFEVRLQR